MNILHETFLKVKTFFENFACSLFSQLLKLCQHFFNSVNICQITLKRRENILSSC